MQMKVQQCEKPKKKHTELQNFHKTSTWRWCSRGLCTHEEQPTSGNVSCFRHFRHFKNWNFVLVAPTQTGARQNYNVRCHFSFSVSSVNFHNNFIIIAVTIVWCMVKYQTRFNITHNRTTNCCFHSDSLASATRNIYERGELLSYQQNELMIVNWPTDYWTTKTEIMSRHDNKLMPVEWCIRRFVILSDRKSADDSRCSIFYFAKSLLLSSLAFYIAGNVLGGLSCPDFTPPDDSSMYLNVWKSILH